MPKINGHVNVHVIAHDMQEGVLGLIMTNEFTSMISVVVIRISCGGPYFLWWSLFVVIFSTKNVVVILTRKRRPTYYDVK